jgi:hypothetical protein
MGERYLTIDQTARYLDATPESIEEQIQRGRVLPTEKRGRQFLSDREVYKLKFVFYLEQKCGLSAEQIDVVLETVSPPYDSWQEQPAIAVD